MVTHNKCMYGRKAEQQNIYLKHFKNCQQSLIQHFVGTQTQPKVKSVRMRRVALHCLLWAQTADRNTFFFLFCFFGKDEVPQNDKCTCLLLLLLWKLLKMVMLKIIMKIIMMKMSLKFFFFCCCNRNVIDLCENKNVKTK